MIKNAKAKGTANEHKTIRWLEELGYFTTRAAGSLGAYDIIAINDSCVLLVQVKSNCWPGPQEREAMNAVCVPENGFRLMVRWNDYDRCPSVRFLSLVIDD